ncbi:TPA: dehydrogenase, partial [Candidatus Sumerlaeota bacterium]|nr:dehydrogenase [Candidatus Sumerlaeota bacterium]
MPKSLVIDPKTVRQKSEITFDPIPVNHYDRSIKQEIESGRFSQADLIRIFRDMTVLRTFETALNEIKLRGNYKGVEYNHRGPAHLSIGQESAAVGMAYTLDENDHIYGSHRSHGEILAKGLSSIHKLGDAKLMDIMSAFFSGDCLRVVEKDAKGDTKDLALDFLLYGAFAEIFGRENGFNKGMGGSMHAFFLPFGIYPN